jgi:hypothetical protein
MDVAGFTLQRYISLEVDADNIGLHALGHRGYVRNASQHVYQRIEMSFYKLNDREEH